MTNNVCTFIAIGVIIIYMVVKIATLQFMVDRLTNENIYLTSKLVVQELDEIGGTNDKK